MDEILEQIAKEHLGLETLETQRSDSLDFSDQSVWALRLALKAAFRAGVNSASTVIHHRAASAGGK